MKITHPELVAALVKPGDEIKAVITPAEAHLLHMIIGLCGEAGELLDALKKSIIYRMPIDRANVVEEMGDIEFYLEGLRQGLGIMRHETISGNITKLLKRYPDVTFTNQDAAERKDKTK